MRLQNKVALITGSARGMGRAAAELFSREGASVILTDIAEQEGAEVARSIQAAGGNAIFVPANVSQATDVEALVEAGIKRFGSIDILYNNAGIMPAADTSVIETSEETWQQIMDVNLKSTFLCCKYTLPYMVQQRRGSIINISSFVVFMGSTVPQEAYGVSKGGLLALTKSLAVQYGPVGIRCNAICPGPINTGLLDHLWASDEERNRRLSRIPLGRFGMINDIIYFALYLASDESSWTTGTWMTIDGGISSNYF
ncbi:SDR family NAD(P)-dependent oxidoreductase [Dictyobacter aurantiacus]|uniref:3-oxoacyl-ACP reductase n=1 Tax=Dictyobacter aurantiacus TaxID=1936993 RepID=A0A401Z8W6_9CHLR|nr:glucose 1-dehydrogenase [Dictyobacter aurantiacus]GCE03295.1 3-oxoacyl-ACP reductase [Dictyobacter aurantiacus]